MGDSGREESCHPASNIHRTPSHLMALSLNETFRVAADPDRVWRFLKSPADVVTCLPGAELTDVIDERTYAGKVTQVISGSIGYDDWEWGVDLFAQDPLTFKKLIYEMRFDEASARFAEFGPFYTGLQFAPAQLALYLGGAVPPLE